MSGKLNGFSVIGVPLILVTATEGNGVVELGTIRAYGVDVASGVPFRLIPLPII